MGDCMSEASVSFRRWQLRTIVCAMIGYALFYFIRKEVIVGTGPTGGL